MPDDYIQLSEPPMLCIQYPTCSACLVDLETDGDGWTCPVCGTLWPQEANDGDRGELYASWSGERATGPVVPENYAHQWGHYYEALQRHESWPHLYPDKPRRPVLTLPSI